MARDLESSGAVGSLGSFRSFRSFRSFGVYVHVPWCRRLCPYCDFPVAVVGRQGIPHRAYLDCVLAELGDYADAFSDRCLVSIYFGGGTPSLWEPACLAEVIQAVRGCASYAAQTLEITLEANPADCTPERMETWRACGINRLSIGVQSLHAGTLVALGRDHSMGDGAQAIAAALGTGLFQVSADVIFSVPASGAASDQGLASALSLADRGVGHLSVYELTIEERTAFGKAYRAGALIPVDDERTAQTYEAIHHALTSRGYEHYEVSSYARPGQRAVHNWLYWHGGEYLGLGAGAASFTRARGGGGERRHNHRAVKQYMRATGRERVASSEVLSAEEVAFDELWLGMRTSHGVSNDRIAPDDRAWLLETGLADVTGDRIYPTLKGFLYSNRIASRLLQK